MLTLPISPASEPARPPTQRKFVRMLVTLAAELQGRLEKRLSEGCSKLAAAHVALQTELGRDILPAQCADMLSQAAVCALPLVLSRKDVFELAGTWLLAQGTAWQQLVLEGVLEAAEVRAASSKPWLTAEDGKVLSTESFVRSTDSPFLPHLYEHFLQEHRRLHRKRGGVFFTPPELVQFITRNVHRQLQQEFGLQQGLGEAHVLDPAAGTGAFLLGAMDIIRETVPNSVEWNQYVVRELLPRMEGVEIIPAACLAAHLNIAARLAETGFEFRLPGKIRVELGNTLADPLDHFKSQISNLKSPLVLLGNPPFSSLSDNRGRWITELVRGSSESPGYVIAGNERLGERKTWLHDDYVKFLRYAQWRIERAGSGIVGFVTNHGYLDNVTFRLMRRELLRVFSRIDLVDLHGNRKKGETSPDGDENIFGLDQGVAVAFFRRLPQQETVAVPAVGHAELWGTRGGKLLRLEALAGNLPPMAPLSPSLPNCLFTPAPRSMPPEYASGWPLPQVMQVHTTAPVTARDSFVISSSRDELCRRITQFRDLAIPDDEIRGRYFTRTRSAKYPSGDTRSWKLSAARRIIAGEVHWESFIRRCLYRPFDWRYIFWHKAMIDWPRTSVVERLESETGDRRQEAGTFSLSPVPCLLLLTRRQMLPTQPCSFFWIADTLPIDGVIRSDNRGSESLFPLYLYDAGGAVAMRHANFAPAFITEVARRLSLTWLPDGRGDLASTFGPEDLLFYIYALFHSPTYRERYAAELRTDFPRVLLPRSREIFTELVPRGERLAGWHTLRIPAPCMNGISPEQLLQFRAGGHQLLRPSRKRKSEQTLLSPLDQPLAPFVAATLHEMTAIDQAINQAGGWPRAFALP